MALLIIYKKINASTLVETLVSTVILLVVFTIATLTLNNLFKVAQKQHTLLLDHHITKLVYFSEHQKLKFPYQETFQDWEINILQKVTGNQTILEITAENERSSKTKTYTVTYEPQ